MTCTGSYLKPAGVPLEFGVGVGEAKAVRRFILISIDVLVVGVATILAIALRENFDITQAKLVALIPYTFFSLGSAFIVFAAGGVDRTPWRHSSIGDYSQIVALTVVLVLLALVVTFATNRLEGVARSLPVIQGVLIATTLVSVRGAARLLLASEIRINGNSQANGHSRETILVVGINTVSKLFLRSVQEFASQEVEVAGLLTDDPAMRGRAVEQKRVLGTIEELPQILGSLEVHGISIDKIVVATPADRLASRALRRLLEIERSSEIVVQFLSERLGFGDLTKAPSVSSRPERKVIHWQRALAPVGSVDHVHSVGKHFWLLKRTIDGFVAALLLFALAPVGALVSLVVALDVGFPLIFWQQRPGLFGRPFKLYKFRTMRAPHDKHSGRIPDDQRLSPVGRILRRTRLDELPQLYNVLVGDMSFVGPRPLLPRDQSPEYADRLSVRPGITGWAQVNGGRMVLPSEKYVLDVWYIKNASFLLDFKIMVRTVQTMLLGDRIYAQAVYQARSDLSVSWGTRLKAAVTPAVFDHAGLSLSTRPIPSISNVRVQAGARRLPASSA